MQDSFLYVVAASPPQQPPAQTTQQPKAEAGGASFEQALDSEMKNPRAPEKEKQPPENSAQEQQAAAASAAAQPAAVQQQQPQQPAAPVEETGAAGEQGMGQAELISMLTEMPPAGAETQTMEAELLQAPAAPAPQGTTASPTQPVKPEAVLPQVQTAPVVPDSVLERVPQIPVGTAAEVATSLQEADAPQVQPSALPEMDPRLSAGKEAQTKPVVLPESAAGKAVQEGGTPHPAASGDLAPDTKSALPEKPVAEKPGTSKAGAEIRPADTPVKGAESAALQEGAISLAVDGDTSVIARVVNEKQVADPARLAEGRSATLVEQMNQAVDGLRKSGQTTLRMQLYPEDLGRINLRLTGSPEGVRVSITADMAATGRLLERHLDDLKQALSDSGVAVVGLAVSQGNDQPGQGFEKAAKDDQGAVFAPSVLPSGGEKIKPSEPASGRSLSSSFIDYRI